MAKYSFYFQDVVEYLSGSEIEIFSSSDIHEIQKMTNDGLNFDYVFFPHYSSIVPDWFLEQYLCIGFHTGDLPNDRGGSPIQRKIARGEYFTFVSALKIIKEVDAGDIICQEKISLETGSIEEILRMISKKIARMILKILRENPEPISQMRSGSISRRFKPQDSNLDFSKLSVRELFDRIRMLDGLDYPAATVKIGPHTLVLTNALLQNGKLTFFAQIEEKR